MGKIEVYCYDIKFLGLTQLAKGGELKPHSSENPDMDAGLLFGDVVVVIDRSGEVGDQFRCRIPHQLIWMVEKNYEYVISCGGENDTGVTDRIDHAIPVGDPAMLMGDLYGFRYAGG